jgi:hypothetical protein
LLKAIVLTLTGRFFFTSSVCLRRQGSSIEDEKPNSEEGDAALEVCNMVVVLPIRLDTCSFSSHFLLAPALHSCRRLLPPPFATFA